jgi:hypothetical protein
MRIEARLAGLALAVILVNFGLYRRRPARQTDRRHAWCRRLPSRCR